MDTQKKLWEAIERTAPLAEVERLYAFHVLERMGGNKVHTAVRLKIDRRTLQRWEKGEKA
jgi:DNA-binding NtrC family response regulator